MGELEFKEFLNARIGEVVAGRPDMFAAVGGGVGVFVFPVVAGVGGAPALPPSVAVKLHLMPYVRTTLRCYPEGQSFVIANGWLYAHGAALDWMNVGHWVGRMMPIDARTV